jgi:heterodisulfide reductase subunit A
MTDRRLGVFICYCGGNISDFVDAEKVRDVVEKENSVIVAKTAMFTCSDATQQEIIEEIKEQKLDGIVVASCSPKLHLNTFRAMAERAGLNPYQYVQVNLREQCSWAHTHDLGAATEKAIRLVRAGIASARLSRPLQKLRVETVPEVLVIGAGVAGLRAALALSDIGITVHIVENSSQPGGMIARLGKLFPNDKRGDEIVSSLLEEVNKRQNVELFTDAEVIEKSGNVGNFSIKVMVHNGDTVSLNVGSIIVTTGFESYMPEEGEFGFGLEGVITLPDYKEMLARSEGGLKFNGKQVGTICYVYCVGSREHHKEENAHLYCSRYCCSAATHAAICTYEVDPAVHQFHLYRDIRTYGKHEILYDTALNQGSLFLCYSEEDVPQVSNEGGKLRVTVKDRLTGGEEIEIEPDLVVLVTGMVSRENRKLENVLKLPIGKDGFYNEIHPKLRPVETVMDGIFIAGASQSPKTLAESVASSMAAVSKSAALLLKGYVDLEPVVAKVDPELCTWCGECLEYCPYGAIQPVKTAGGKEIAEISAVLCKGEGACVSICPQHAITVEGYTSEQIDSMIEALAAEVA